MPLPSSAALLDELDALVGSRETTCELIALASAAVLTASPPGSERLYLRQVEELRAVQEAARQPTEASATEASATEASATEASATEEPSSARQSAAASSRPLAGFWSGVPWSELRLNNRIGPAFPEESRSGLFPALPPAEPELADELGPPHSPSRRAAGLRHLLDALSQEHGQDATALLGRLRALAAEALSELAPEDVRKWSTLLERTRRTVQQGYLRNHPDLN